MSVDEQHVALPKLYGAPAYARPPAAVRERPRPFDPDELPLVAEQTDDERRLMETLPARAYAPGGGIVLESTEGERNGNGNAHHRLEPRQFRLRSLADRLLSHDRKAS